MSVNSLGDAHGHGTLPAGGSGGGMSGGGLRDAAARLAMLPLRLFLGGTFLYAGIDKFTGAGPFTAVMDAGTMEAMLASSREAAAAPWLTDLVLERPGLFLDGAAVAEIAVGAGLLLGLLTRAAAAVGALLALGLWLTVTFASEPYYFGQDLPYLAGFVTLVLAGSGPFALDRYLSARRADRSRRLFG